jgi:hypothetical protein
MLFRKNVIEKSFMNWRVLSMVKINTPISDTPCISLKNEYVLFLCCTKFKRPNQISIARFNLNNL